MRLVRETWGIFQGFVNDGEEELSPGDDVLLLEAG